MSSTIPIPGFIPFEQIAEGGNGTVIKVQSEYDGRLYAAKIVSNTTETLKRRINREADFMSSCNHPRIIKYFKTVQLPGSTALIMELGGKSLHDYMEYIRGKNAVIPRETMYWFFVDVASALVYLHTYPGQTRIHGDIKPRNILICDDRHAKLCDLGSADVEDDETEATKQDKTVKYTAPELLGDSPKSAATDMWAFGVTLYEVFTGEQLFSAKLPHQVINQILKFKPSDLPTTLEEPVRDLLKQLLNPNPEGRLTSEQLFRENSLRCLLSTPDMVWRLIDQADAENLPLTGSALDRVTPRSTSTQTDLNQSSILNSSTFGKRQKQANNPQQRSLLSKTTLFQRSTDQSSQEPVHDEIVFSSKDHFDVVGARYTRTSKGQNSDGNAVTSTVVFNDSLHKKLVQMDFTIEKLVTSKKFDTRLNIGLMTFKPLLPDPGLRLGTPTLPCSLCLNVDGRLHISCPESSLESTRVDCFRPLQEGDTVRIVVDLISDPRYVVFYVNDQIGKCFLTHLPEEMRFAVSVFMAGNSFTASPLQELQHAPHIPPEVVARPWWKPRND
ncbi:putative serine/threonine protein kinase [Blattamonas nauphoetae]|uniref:non-specific serine/threonine protein kinase n=1 Tax=Blattamonas nauphoetae TaxID=2049346 RepID=A0ABQ9WSE9_9EUKA|nr:putative serine/threonine protein kinase [Blattamonas nauphoetae]